MKVKKTIARSSFLPVAAVLLTIVFSCTTLDSKAQQGLTVIGNQKGAPAALSFRELKSVLLGEKQRWGNGNKVLIALMKTNISLGRNVCEKIYQMQPDELNKYWIALIFQGKASAPTYFNSTSDLQSFVAQNPGSIGIIDQPVSTADIKTILVDGKKTLN